MTTSEWLIQAETFLNQSNIQTARLDSLVLLSDELGVEKSNILAYPDRILQGSSLNILNNNIIQRSHHTPLAYIRGKAEFYGREFLVTHNVLVPRPESESIIDLLRVVTKHEKQAVIDVGTGSGCLIVTAKLEYPATNAIAIDIDKTALKVAQENARHLNADISFLQGDLLKPLQHLASSFKDSIILANLPYVPYNYPINEAASHEPPMALFSDHNGLAHYEQLFEQLTALPHLPFAVITESLLTQHKELRSLAHKTGYEQEKVDGLAQLFIKK